MPPSPPEHLEEARSIVKDGNVDVKIQWQPPLYTDGLLIHKYEVSDCTHTHACTHAFPKVFYQIMHAACTRRGMV